MTTTVARVARICGSAMTITMAVFPMTRTVSITLTGPRSRGDRESASGYQ